LDGEKEKAKERERWTEGKWETRRDERWIDTPPTYWTPLPLVCINGVSQTSECHRLLPSVLY
jgi:hypothetical protein